MPDDIFTQAGCNVTTKCSAENPRRIEWSTRRTSFTFENTTTRSAWVSVACVVCVCVCVSVCMSVCKLVLSNIPVV